MKRLGQQPKVSVLMLAFNHDRYIEQAIESVLNQDAGHPFEIVIGEDHSTDDTVDIVRAYTERYPTVIRATLGSGNIGFQRNFARTFQLCHGQYVAMLECDDYWLSPHKLKKQVTTLDNNLDCSMCFSRARILYEGMAHGNRDVPLLHRARIGLKEILIQNFVPTCTVVFRRNMLTIPYWLEEMPFVDWFMYALLAQRGEILFIPKTLGVYRIHGNGVWSSMTPEEKNRSNQIFYGRMESYLSNQYTAWVRHCAVTHKIET